MLKFFNKINSAHRSVNHGKVEIGIETALEPLVPDKVGHLGCGVIAARVVK